MRKKKYLLACEENLLVWLNFLRAEILWPPLNTKIGMTCLVFYSYFVMILPDIAPKLAVAESRTGGLV